jgi:hypothetical protein
MVFTRKLYPVWKSGNGGGGGGVRGLVAGKMAAVRRNRASSGRVVRGRAGGDEVEAEASGRGRREREESRDGDEPRDGDNLSVWFVFFFFEK